MAEAAGEKTGRGADEREELEGGVVMAHIIIHAHESSSLFEVVI
jgi:hypothetical protein